MTTAIEYTDDPTGITPDRLAGFFVGWPTSPSPETHLRILHRSHRVWLALDGDRVVGFITAISDGVLSAYLPLLEVLPSHQGRGIGTELTRRMLETLHHLYMIDLTCDPDVQEFYGRLGMSRGSAMLIRNYDRQSGAD